MYPARATRNFTLDVGVALALALSVAGTGCAEHGALPATAFPQAGTSSPTSIEQTAIEGRDICVGSAVASAGDLADTLYYRASVLPDGKLAVGYFAFFSEERPWGNNWLTWTVLPALAIDMFYTRSLFVGPGLQRALSGKGDVEGFRVVYDLRPDGTLEVERAVADDGSHTLVYLDRADVMSLDPARPTFYSDVWSHQLGGRGLHSKAQLAYLQCFGKGHVRPLPDTVDADFALEGRARPAHIEALGGRVVGGPFPVAEKASGPAPRM